MSYSFRYFFLFSIMLLSITCSLFKGSTSLSLYQLLTTDQAIFFHLRLPRTINAFTTGGLLALSGAYMQLLLENPLADPYILGNSSGAALCTLIFMLLGLPTSYLLGGAWLGSLGSMMIILLFAKQHRFHPPQLLLLGIAIASTLSAAISFLLLLTPADHLHHLLFWLFGDLSETHFSWVTLAVLVIGLVSALLLAPALNVLARGNTTAQILGLPTTQLRLLLYLLASLFTATAVMLAGPIGFLGLIAPHLARLLIGYNHRQNLPMMIIIGGSLLTLADTLSRTLFAPVQIPVGILITLIGAPLFIWQLQQ
jgi:iron complex transport system permease protein